MLLFEFLIAVDFQAGPVALPGQVLGHVLLQGVRRVPLRLGQLQGDLHAVPKIQLDRFRRRRVPQALRPVLRPDAAQQDVLPRLGPFHQLVKAHHLRRGQRELFPAVQLEGLRLLLPLLHLGLVVLQQLLRLLLCAVQQGDVLVLGVAQHPEDLVARLPQPVEKGLRRHHVRPHFSQLAAQAPVFPLAPVLRAQVRCRLADAAESRLAKGLVLVQDAGLHGPQGVPDGHELLPAHFHDGHVPQPRQLVQVLHQVRVDHPVVQPRLLRLDRLIGVLELQPLLRHLHGVALVPLLPLPGVRVDHVGAGQIDAVEYARHGKAHLLRDVLLVRRPQQLLGELLRVPQNAPPQLRRRPVLQVLVALVPVFVPDLLDLPLPGLPLRRHGLPGPLPALGDLRLQLGLLLVGKGLLRLRHLKERGHHVVGDLRRDLFHVPAVRVLFRHAVKVSCDLRNVQQLVRGGHRGRLRPLLGEKLRPHLAQLLVDLVDVRLPLADAHLAQVMLAPAVVVRDVVALFLRDAKGCLFQVAAQLGVFLIQPVVQGHGALGQVLGDGLRLLVGHLPAHVLLLRHPVIQVLQAGG